VQSLFAVNILDRRMGKIAILQDCRTLEVCLFQVEFRTETCSARSKMKSKVKIEFNSTQSLSSLPNTRSLKSVWPVEVLVVGKLLE